MGNEQSLQPPSMHSRFYSVKYSKTDSSMYIQQPISSQSLIFIPWQQKNKLYKHIYHNNDLALLQDYKIKKNNYCNNSCTFIGKYTHRYQINMKQQIKKRQINKIYFTQQQIWYIILILARCAAHIYKFGQKHIIGNIHPYNILINSKNQYKIIPTNFSYGFPGQSDHFQQFRKYGDSQAFISPELIGFLNNAKYKGYPFFPECIQKQVSESFCFGMTILSIAILQSKMMKCYQQKGNMKNNLIHSFKIKNTVSSYSKSISQSFSSSSSNNQQYDNAYLQNIDKQYMVLMLNRLKQRYSSILYDIVVSLIMPDPLKRMKIDRLYNQFLISFEANILKHDDSWLQKVQDSLQKQRNSDL